MTEDFSICCLRDMPALLHRAALWFHGKWDIPEEAYQESMEQCLKGGAVPQWYAVLNGDGVIAAGAGVIENDYHSRRDLTPNLCALFVEPACRRHGLAKKLLNFIRRDMAELGVERLYLVTEHTAFYERCGWSFLTTTTGEDGLPLRIYSAPTALERTSCSGGKEKT